MRWLVLISGFLLVVYLGRGLYSEAAGLEEGALVRCDPEGADGQVGEIVSVDLYAEGVDNLYALDVRLQFDATLAQVVDADPRAPGIQIQPLFDFLSPDFVIRRDADNQAGTIWYAVTQLNPREAVSGSGPLARVSFIAVREGLLTMPFTNAQLVRRDLTPIQVTPVACVINFTSALPTPEPTVTPVISPVPEPTPTISVTPTAIATPEPEVATLYLPQMFPGLPVTLYFPLLIAE
jgi:hypothetical protein